MKNTMKQQKFDSDLGVIGFDFEQCLTQIQGFYLFGGLIVLGYYLFCKHPDCDVE